MQRIRWQQMEVEMLAESIRDQLIAYGETRWTTALAEAQKLLPRERRRKVAVPTIQKDLYAALEAMGVRFAQEDSKGRPWFLCIPKQRVHIPLPPAQCPETAMEAAIKELIHDILVPFQAKIAALGNTVSLLAERLTKVEQTTDSEAILSLLEEVEKGVGGLRTKVGGRRVSEVREIAIGIWHRPAHEIHALKGALPHVHIVGCGRNNIPPSLQMVFAHTGAIKPPASLPTTWVDGHGVPAFIRAIAKEYPAE